MRKTVNNFQIQVKINIASQLQFKKSKLLRHLQIGIKLCQGSSYKSKLIKAQDIFILIIPNYQFIKWLTKDRIDKYLSLGILMRDF